MAPFADSGLAMMTWQEAVDHANSLPSYLERALSWSFLVSHADISATVCATLSLAYAQLHLAEVMEGKA